MRALLLLLALGVGTVGCDQATKQAAVTHIKDGPEMSALGGSIRLTYAENPGAFLGVGSRLSGGARSALFVALNLVLLGALAWWAFGRERAVLVRAAAMLVLAGGVSNLIDRLVRDGGRVVDFLAIGVGPVRTGIFNVADVALMLGVAGLLWTTARRARGT